MLLPHFIRGRRRFRLSDEDNLSKGPIAKRECVPKGKVNKTSVLCRARTQTAYVSTANLTHRERGISRRVGDTCCEILEEHRRRADVSRGGKIEIGSDPTATP